MRPLTVLMLAFGLLAPRAICQVPPTPLPPNHQSEPVSSEAAALAKVEPALLFTAGEVDVVISLQDPPLAVAAGKNAKRLGSRMSPRQQLAYVTSLRAKQSTVIDKVRAEGGTDVARYTKVMNAVVARIDSAKLTSVAKLATVTGIRPVVDYELDLSQTVPYIGAAALRSLGLDGTGVRIAVIDSGIDYTHRNLGGPGTLAAYEAAYGTGPDDPQQLFKTRDGLFPTDKVIGGYDYVGESWPNSIFENRDDDPIDYGGHGTHVADIIAGKSADGTHKGVAPGAKLYAFKACSAVSTACSGIGIMSALEASLNPDHPEAAYGGGDPSGWVIDNPVDVVNLSLGRPYGMIENQLTAAVQALVDFGVVVVASAGNSGDKPYVIGSPSTAPGAISVAQTEVPGAKGGVITIRDSAGGTRTIRNTASVDWAPLTATVSGEIVYQGNLACPADSVDPALVAGKIVLIDRGSCAVSLKVDKVGAAGAIGVILGLVAPGDPISFSYGGGTALVPTLVVTQADANYIKSKIAAGTTRATLSPLSLAGSMVSTSSRGPSISFQSIKPDIGAPGASVSAVVGTGTGEAVFGGTSGAAPMVSGSAALLLQGLPSLVPQELMARLMNNANPNIMLNPLTLPGVLAPITRIGAGEVRVNKAYAAKTIAYDKATLLPSLSFGYYALPASNPAHEFVKTVEVKNLGASRVVYRPSAIFRYAITQKSGAATIRCTPSEVSVAPGGTGTFDVVLKVDATRLPEWTLNGGPQGGNGELLRQLEYSGFVYISSSTESIRLPWHILPHKAADLVADTSAISLGAGGGFGTFTLENPNGATAGYFDLFSLVGTSPKLTIATPGPGSGRAINDLRAAGLRYFSYAGENYLEIAISTYTPWAHPNIPGSFEVLLDVNEDGEVDYIVRNDELFSGGVGTGQNVVYIYRYDGPLVGIPFYTQADLNSSTVIMTVPMSMLSGLTPATKIGMLVLAYDNYFSTTLWDWIDANGSSNPIFKLAQYTPATPRFFTLALTGGGPLPILGDYLPAGDALDFLVGAVPGGMTASPDHEGIMFIYWDHQKDRASQEIEVTP